MKKLLDPVLELVGVAGLALIVAGIAEVSHAVALIATGVMVVGIVYLLVLER